MSLDSELVDHVLPKLRGYFRELYVGGSYATYKALKSDIKPNDVDIFILGPKRLETWALKQILETIFDEVFAEGDNPDYYKIEGQYKRAQCFIGPHKFDLIFVDQTIENLITKQTAADISKMYYSVTWCITDGLLHLYYESKYILSLIEKTKVCLLNKSLATDQHTNKIIDRCRNLNLTIKYTL